MPKFHLPGKGAFGAGAVFLTGGELQNRGNPLAAGHGLCQVDDQVRRLDQLHQDLRHIVIQGDYQALGQDTGIHLPGPQLHQQNHRQIHYHQCHRVQQCRDPRRTSLPCGKCAGFLAEALNLVLLLAERPQNTNAAEVLPGGRGHTIHVPLNTAVHRHGNQHDTKYDQAQHQNQPQENQSRLGINGKSHHHGTQHHKRRPQQQPQSQVHAVLQLVDIRCHTGDHGGAAHFIDLAVAEPQDMLHHRMAKSAGKAHRRSGRKILGRHRHSQSNNTQHDHHKTHPQNISLVSPANALIYDPGNHQRDQKLKARLQQLKQRAEDTLLLIALHIFPKLFQINHPSCFPVQ